MARFHWSKIPQKILPLPLHLTLYLKFPTLTWSRVGHYGKRGVHDKRCLHCLHKVLLAQGFPQRFQRQAIYIFSSRLARLPPGGIIGKIISSPPPSSSFFFLFPASHLRM